MEQIKVDREDIEAIREALEIALNHYRVMITSLTDSCKDATKRVVERNQISIKVYKTKEAELVALLSKVQDGTLDG